MMNWTNRLKRDAKGAKGFTLIELMIVIAIIGILAAVAIPNFLKARDRGRFSACKESLAGLKTAVEMVAADNPGTTGPYENAAWGKDNLCKEMLADEACTDAKNLNDRMIGSCNLNGASFVTILDTPTTAGSYEIKGKAMDKLQCQICANPNGVYPPNYDKTKCAEGKCP